MQRGCLALEPFVLDYHRTWGPKKHQSVVSPDPSSPTLTNTPDLGDLRQAAKEGESPKRPLDFISQDPHLTAQSVGNLRALPTCRLFPDSAWQLAPQRPGRDPPHQGSPGEEASEGGL